MVDAPEVQSNNFLTYLESLFTWILVPLYTFIMEAWSPISLAAFWWDWEVPVQEVQFYKSCKES